MPDVFATSPGAVYEFRSGGGALPFTLSVADGLSFARVKGVVTAVGIQPTHIDSHRHAHALPGILPAVAAVAYDAKVPVVRRPLDSPSLLDPMASAKMLQPVRRAGRWGRRRRSSAVQINAENRNNAKSRWAERR